MKTKCKECGKGEYDYSMSDIHLIPNTQPQEAGIEGICSECSSHIYIKFRAYQEEITPLDDFMEAGEKKVTTYPIY